MSRTETGSAIAHEEVLFSQNRGSGLRAIIAIHSTALGPALGGARFHPYASDEEALVDVLRLSRAMTYKNSAAGLDLGGGKAIIFGDPHREKTEPLLSAFGRLVDRFGGRYITTEDVGTSEADMNLIRSQTRHVTGISIDRGGSGDPSEATAWGVFNAVRELAQRVWGGNLDGRHVAIQGVGKVGSQLARYLAREGCRLTVADQASDAIARLVRDLDVTVVPPDRVHAVRCDVFSPCALASAITPRTVPELRCEAIVGCANNQLGSPECAQLLAERGILYAPDFIVNAGGAINIAHELAGYDRERAFAHVARIGETLIRVIERADADGITPSDAASRLAESRLHLGAGAPTLTPGQGGLDWPAARHLMRASN